MYCGLYTCTVDCTLVLWTVHLYCGLYTCTVDCTPVHQDCTLVLYLIVWGCIYALNVLFNPLIEKSN